jgi:DNA polymerase-3 subunit epsilon
VSLEKLVFVDIETTGTSVTRDRIIEIAVIRVENGEIVDRYQSLIDPGTYVSPFIEAYTGIKRDELDKAPSFASIAETLLELFAECTFVAHNVRFDYGFIKNEFQRINISYSSKLLCTVKLSRRLYPEEKHHNLSAIIDRLDIPCPNRHRAMSDVEATWQFFNHAVQLLDTDSLKETVTTLTKRPSIPPQIAKEEIDNLPNSPGVYIFYDDHDYPLYVGKSVTIRDRVLSHFASDITAPREMRLSQQVHRIEAIQTAGELGALLKESALVKELQPLYNRKLRQSRELVAAIMLENEKGFLTTQIASLEKDQTEQAESIVALFKSRKQAKNELLKIAKEHQLCHKLLNLESATTACFPYQLGWCKGACIGKEIPIRYNLRFIEAFQKTRIKQWPFSGEIAVTEQNQNDDRYETFFIDHWQLIGHVSNESERINTFLPFDYDTYAILSRYVFSEKHQRSIKVQVEKTKTA